MTRVPANTSRFSHCCPAKRQVLRIQPCSLAKAISEPVKATVPISAPSPPTTSTTGPNSEPGCCACNSSIAAMAPAAPPPMPLYSAIICGMAVMATRLAPIQASMPLEPIAASISQ